MAKMMNFLQEWFIGNEFMPDGCVRTLDPGSYFELECCAVVLQLFSAPAGARDLNFVERKVSGVYNMAESLKQEDVNEEGVLNTSQRLQQVFTMNVEFVV